MSFEFVSVRTPDGTQTIPADKLPLRAGTAADCDVRLPGPGGSPVLLIDLLDGLPIVQPVGRSEQLRLNDEALTASKRLSDGDRIDYFGTALNVSLGDTLAIDIQLEASAYVTRPPELERESADSESIAATSFSRARAEARPVDDKPQRSFKALIASLFVFLVISSFYLFTSRSIQFDVQPGPADELNISGGWFRLPLGNRILMRPGEYTVSVEKVGYYPVNQAFEVGDEQSQTVAVALRRLPGELFVTTNANDEVTVSVNGAVVGTAPLGPLELQPGEHSLSVNAERYLAYSDVVSIPGLGKRVDVSVQLVPRWADVSIRSEPAGASVFAGEQELGKTPLVIELLEGTHPLSVVADGFRAWDGSVTAEPDTDIELPLIQLQPAEARLLVNTVPRGANVTVNGRYRGQSPITLDLSPDVDYRIGLSRVGYGSTTRQVRLRAAASDSITVDLSAQAGEIQVNVSPADAEIVVDGRSRGQGSRKLTLSAAPHRIVVRRDGYQEWSRTLTPRPGYPQSVTASLRSLEAIRRASIATDVSTSQEAMLKRIEPGEFSMGSSRSEPGRRANEVIVPVRLTRPYYIGTREVTNREFAEFKRGHDSGADVHIAMAGDSNPVANVSWEDAVQYCNWLSQQEGLTPVYKEEFGKWVAIRPFPDGYRLPTEAEWSWALRYAGRASTTRFSWGNDWPPRANSGNFADKSAIELVPSIIPRYDDGFASTASGGRFAANPLGLYDGAGNVSEWVNDYYSVPTPGLTEAQVDPLGPERGDSYVIRGSSWRDALESELRMSYRDSGENGRTDVGFRIARNAE